MYHIRYMIYAIHKTYMYHYTTYNSHHITTICHIVLYYTVVWYLGYNSNNTCYTKVHSIAYIA